MLKRVKLVALAGVVAGAALLPLYGDPRNTALTHAEWARMLLRALDLGHGGFRAATASEAFSTLSWKGSLRLRADRYVASDAVEVAREGERGRVTPTGDVGQVSYPLSVVRGGDYRVRLHIAGGTQPASAEIARVGEVKAKGVFALTPGARMGWVDAGQSHLDPGAYQATVLLPRGAVLEEVEIAPPCLSPVEPPAGWRATAVLDTEEAAVTMVQALDGEAELPPSDAAIEVDASQFTTEAGVTTLASGLVPAPGGVAIKAGAGGLRAVVFVDIPEPGLYTLSAFGALGSGQSWTADGCRKAVLCSEPAEADLMQWRPVMTGEFTAGRHSLAVRLGMGASIQRLRAQRKKETPADYAATLRRIGFDVGPPGPMSREKAIDAMHFLEGRVTPMRTTRCGDVVLPQTPTLRAGLEIADVPGPAVAPASAGTGQPGLGGGAAVPPPSLPDQETATPVLPVGRAGN